jgi:uncharacterized FAD-dependent dehydrogenase
MIYNNIQITVLPKQAATANLLKEVIADKINISSQKITSVRITRKSIDARSKVQVKINLTVDVYTEGSQPEKVSYPFHYRNVENEKTVIVVGAGPAGIFAALRLIELGLKPVIIERGKDVSERKKDIAQLNRNNGLNPDSNYCFGEGGAGTFSDGKLFTRSKKKGDCSRILLNFHLHGAQDEILFETHPHIGTDKLPEIIKNMRQTILHHGGEVHFETKMSGLIVENNKIKGIRTNKGEWHADAVILATGHSARDVYEMLQNQQIKLEAKGFAMGVRVEHPQILIDKIQYHAKERGNYLPPASYNLVTQVEGRGVYSFCMCPGGFIVPASTFEKETVVNGMSPANRNSDYANSGIVVEIRTEDLDEYASYGDLAGMKFQQHYENLAFVNGAGKQTAPAQRLSDFVKGRLSVDLPPSSYLPGLIPSPIHFWMPEFIRKRLQEAFINFDKKMKGFLTNEALLVGVESRTSSPVRIPRDPETLQHISVEGLYPCGEGAGYAGGITSSAMDGENCAEKIAGYFQQSNLKLV